MYWEGNYNEKAFNPNLGFKVPNEIVAHVERRENLSIDNSPQNSSIHDPLEEGAQFASEAM